MSVGSNMRLLVFALMRSLFSFVVIGQNAYIIFWF